MPNEANEIVMITVRMSGEEREALNELARSEKMSLNAYCRARLGLDSETPKLPKKSTKKGRRRRPGNPHWRGARDEHGNQIDSPSELLVKA